MPVTLQWESWTLASHSPVLRIVAPVSGCRLIAAIQVAAALGAPTSSGNGPSDIIGDSEADRRVVHDLYCIGPRSVWLDLQILPRIAIRGFFHQNAY